jgi:hypothetical protein
VLTLATDHSDATTPANPACSGRETYHFVGQFHARQAGFAGRERRQVSAGQALVEQLAQGQVTIG